VGWDFDSAEGKRAGDSPLWEGISLPVLGKKGVFGDTAGQQERKHGAQPLLYFCTITCSEGCGAGMQAGRQAGRRTEAERQAEPTTIAAHHHGRQAAGKKPKPDPDPRPTDPPPPNAQSLSVWGPPT